MKKKKHLFYLVITLIIFYGQAFGQKEELKKQIEKLLIEKKATVGVSIISNDLKDTINLNESMHFPMQSVFKFPIALAVLAEIDKGKFTLDQKIKITSKDLLPDTWSPIRDQFPNGTDMSIREVIKFTVSQSDNNGCDILLRLLGGPDVVETFLKNSKIADISIKVNEEEMHKEWNVQFQNWATPFALTKLLIRTYTKGANQLLAEKNYDCIWSAMKETSTGMKRIRGQLPADAVVFHKTGTSATNEKNITAAINDVGIISLPNGNSIFISILITDSSEDEPTNEKIISDIAKLTWNYYTK